MLLDSQLSARLRSPSPWELAQWRAHPASWEQHLDTAVRCFEDEAAVTEAVNEYLLLFRRNEARRPRSHGAFSEIGRLVYYIARNLFSWIRADYRTEAAGKVTQFNDKVALVSEGAVAPNARSIDSAHAMSQGTSGLQVAAVTIAADFNGKEVATFTGGQRYQSSFTSQWQYEYDGSGAELWVVASQTTASTGMFLSWGTNGVPPEVYMTSTPTFQYELYGGAFAIPKVPAGTPFVFNGYNKEGASPEVYLKTTGSTAVTGSRAGSSPPAPTAARVIGSTSVGGFPMSARAAEIMSANRIDSTLEANVARYILLRYGMAA